MAGPYAERWQSLTDAECLNIAHFAESLKRSESDGNRYWTAKQPTFNALAKCHAIRLYMSRKTYEEIGAAVNQRAGLQFVGRTYYNALKNLGFPSSEKERGDFIKLYFTRVDEGRLFSDGAQALENSQQTVQEEGTFSPNYNPNPSFAAQALPENQQCTPGMDIGFGNEQNMDFFNGGKAHHEDHQLPSVAQPHFNSTDQALNQATYSVTGHGDFQFNFPPPPTSRSETRFSVNSGTNFSVDFLDGELHFDNIQQPSQYTQDIHHQDPTSDAANVLLRDDSWKQTMPHTMFFDVSQAKTPSMDLDEVANGYPNHNAADIISDQPATYIFGSMTPRQIGKNREVYPPRVSSIPESYRNSLSSTVYSADFSTSSRSTSRSDHRYSTLSTSTCSSFGELQNLRPVSHDPHRGLWNNNLHVVPCDKDHSIFDPNFTDCHGCGLSPLSHLCIFAGHMNPNDFQMRVATVYGQDISDHTDLAGNTPLHYLAAAGVHMQYFEIFQCFFNRTQDYMVQNSTGQNPLHVLDPAALKDNLVVLLHQIKFIYSESLTQHDEKGLTPLQAILHYPLASTLYLLILESWTNPAHQLLLKDRNGNDCLSLMNSAASRRHTSDSERALILGGREQFLKFLKSQAPPRNIFHSIAYEAYTSVGDADFSVCELCDPPHGNSFAEMIRCALSKGYDPDEYEHGVTPLHSVGRTRYSNPDFDGAQMETLCKLQAMLNERTNLRQGLLMRDHHDESLVYSLAKKGYAAALEAVLNYEHEPMWRRALVNTCAQTPASPCHQHHHSHQHNKNGSNTTMQRKSVLAATREEHEKEYTRIKRMKNLTLGVKRGDDRKLKGLAACIELLARNGAELNPTLKLERQVVRER